MHWPRIRKYLSIVLVVYRMPDQADRTLYSLSPSYQRDVDEKEYEVIVVENGSERMLGAERARRHAGNVRYLARQEPLRTPVNAINEAAALARGSHIAVMIDGARLLTPGVVRLALDAFRVRRHAAVAAPGYHIGRKLQQELVNEGYDEAEESRLLDSIGWPANGYRLHEISVLSGSCQDGFLLPNPESNFLATSMQRWRAIGGIDARFDDYGGGYANLDLYKRLLEHPDTPCFFLFGEGTFHQYHGGVTTGSRDSELGEIYRLIDEQYRRIRGGSYERPQQQPVLFGRIHPPAYRFMQQSLDRAQGG